jgi:hypothetical protein
LPLAATSNLRKRLVWQTEPARDCRQISDWRLPLRETLEELRADPRVADITAAFTANLGGR